MDHEFQEPTGINRPVKFLVASDLHQNLWPSLSDERFYLGKEADTYQRLKALYNWGVEERAYDYRIIAGDMTDSILHVDKTDQFGLKKTIRILGNHDYWDNNCTLQEVQKRFLAIEQRHDAPINHVHLEKTYLQIPDTNVFVFGGTMWTSLRNPIGRLYVENNMNDFQYIKDVTSDDIMNDFYAFKGRLEHFLYEHTNDRVVVVSHHAPSYQSKWAPYSDALDDAYYESLDGFIFDHPQIKLWIHGHTHEQVDYKIGTTRVVSNPFGYINKSICMDVAGIFDHNFIVEV